MSLILNLLQQSRVRLKKKEAEEWEENSSNNNAGSLIEAFSVLKNPLKEDPVQSTFYFHHHASHTTPIASETYYWH